MHYSCTHMATVGVKGLICDSLILVCLQLSATTIVSIQDWFLLNIPTTHFTHNFLALTDLFTEEKWNTMTHKTDIQ